MAASSWSRSRRVDANARKDTPSLIGPQEHLGRSRTRPFAGDRFTEHRERSGYEASQRRLTSPRFGNQSRVRFMAKKKAFAASARSELNVHSSRVVSARLCQNYNKWKCQFYADYGAF